MNNTARWSLVILFVFACDIFLFAQDKPFPAQLKPYIQSITYQPINGQYPKVSYAPIEKNITKVSLEWNLADSIKQDDWQVNIIPGFNPNFHWAPHLTPTDDHIIAQHVFRAPALIAASSQKQITIIPDLDILQLKQSPDWYMDLNAAKNTLTLGMSKSQVKEHTAYVRAPGTTYAPGKLVYGFYIMTEAGKNALANPWRKSLDFFWKNWGNKAYQDAKKSQPADMEPLVAHTYNWAFKNWKDVVWQEFDLNGKQVGAPQFIVNVTQSPNYPGEVNEREFRSIWNQAWFNSLRSAQGLYRYAKRTGNKEFLDYALKTKELALAFPQTKGFFPGLIATEMEQVEINGKKYNRSKGWNTYYFGNSNRNPYTFNAKESPLHILDMSFTASLMLSWYNELEKDQRLLDYAKNYADALISIQDSDGFFPAWLDASTFEPLPYLKQSPETSMSVTFLLQAYEITKSPKYKEAALKAMDAVMRKNIPVGEWEDFETYWSCSRYGSKDLVGKKVERNNMYKQNNFCMYWTAEALLKAYRLTKNEKYLNTGRRTLDEMLMCQATWQPPYIYVDALGGFGVMNFDGEWNDARQSIFAELIVEYGKLLRSKEYTERGLAALRASFLMIYSPENQKTKKQWEARWNFFGEKDYGFMMENYGHGGVTNNAGVGIGEFTIYDWGNGAAAEAYNRMADHYGEEFIRAN